MVGRDREQQRIGALLAAARVGQSGVLVITGDPGIGKTALLEHAKRLTEDMVILTAVGTDAERDLPFAGLAQLLRLTATELERLPAPQAQALAVALALRSGQAVDRFSVGAGLLTLLTQRSEDRPLCLVIDDAHLVDRPSQEALVFVARRLLADAVALIVAARTGEPCLLVADDLPQLRLAGIDAVATRELVGADLGVLATAELSDRVFALSGGNPLAVRELVLERDRLLSLPPDAPGPLSAVLAGLYSRRAADLDPAAATALLVAAAAGEDLAVVRRACDVLGAPVAALADAEAAGLVSVTADRVRFRHPLVRSGVYAAATPARRRLLHAAIADAMGDAAADADRRCWHRSEAALGPDAATADEMEAAAGRAAGRGAYAVAAKAAERAAVLSPTAAEQAARLSAAGTWSWHAGEVVAAQALLARAAALEATSTGRVRSRRLQGVIAARCGAVDQARDLLMHAGAESPDASEAIACYAEAIDACYYLGDAATAVLAAERVETLLRQADAEAGVLGLIAAGMAKVLAGQDGAPLIREAVQRAERAGIATPGQDAAVGQPYEAFWLVMGPMFLRDSGGGRELVQRVVADQRARSAIGALPHLLFHIARDEATTDRWANAEADYNEAIGLARESGQSTELAMSLAGLCWLEARQGRSGEARTHAAETLQLSETHRVEIGRIWALFALGDLALGYGSIASSLEHYRSVDRVLGQLGLLDVDLSPVPELVEAMLRCGETGGTAVMSRTYQDRAVAKGQPWALARAARTQALLCDDAQLDEAFGRALELHTATLDAFERARTQLSYGGRLRRARRRVDARAMLSSALETFTRLGSRPWAEAAADELQATGMTIARPGQNPISRLTPRELQIAVPLADGRTIRQVASALFLSPKTVEYHLRNVYRKFGIDSRSQLAARMSEQR
nr:AAA family ATPase [Microlunatus panaciterrae]